MNKKRNQAYRKKRNYKAGKNSKSKPRKIPFKNQLFTKYKDDLGEEYSLNDVFEIAYPRIETSIDVLVSGKPNDILQDLHILLLEAIEMGLNTKERLAHFLGITTDDFILDELYSLLKEGLIAITEIEGYRITTKGEEFVRDKKFIPVTSQETFTFYVDGFNTEISTKEIPKTNCEYRLTSTLKVDYKFVQLKWSDINKAYSKSENYETEIIDLANYKRSIIGKPRVKYYKIFALLYYPKDTSGKKIQLKAYSPEGEYLKHETSIIETLFSQNKYLFDFSQELESTTDFKTEFIQETSQINEEKRLSGRYQDISTFEHKELVKDALLTAQTAVYIESPWIRKATMNYLKEIKSFLEKSNTKLFIAYGIDSRPQNKPHQETFEELQRLKSKYPNKFFLFHLPTHFEEKFPKRQGSHRKILIKDYEYYVKGSFNWLSYYGKESESYAVEEGTQFFDNVDEFWLKVFSDYKLDTSLLN